MNGTDSRTPEGKENSRTGAKNHMQRLMADPVAWKARQEKMLASRKKSNAIIKKLRETGELETY